MRIVDQHERIFPLRTTEVGALIDRLATDQDGIWPQTMWPALQIARPLKRGAHGQHGRMRYEVEEYHPGRYLKFRFVWPSCLRDGRHWFEVIESPDAATLRHTLAVDVKGRALLAWVLVWRPLHRACLEDAMATAQATLRQRPTAPQWSRWVKLLRYLAYRGNAGRQCVPDRRKTQRKPPVDPLCGRICTRPSALVPTTPETYHRTLH